MGKAIQIKSVDFSSVALAKVNFTDSIPCTGLELNKSTMTFEKVGDTDTLVATKTPENTTDVVSWSSSNENVATVENGVVTIHGIGTATITATCGNQTASATISQTSIKAAGTLMIYTDKAISDYESALFITSAANNTCFVNKYTDNDKVRILYGAGLDAEAIPVPYGATKIKAKTENNTAISFNYMYRADMNDLVQVYSSTYPKYIDYTNWVSSSTGGTVEYGQCVAFKAASASVTDTVEYFYFE